MSVGKKSIADMQALAAKHEGTCLSTEYVDRNTPLLWKCFNPDHEPWLSRPINITAGHWCARCFKESVAEKYRKYCIEDLRALAAEHDGKCLGDEYTNQLTKMRWECGGCGREFSATARHALERPVLCVECSSGRTIVTIELLQELAVKNGGELP